MSSSSSSSSTRPRSGWVGLRTRIPPISPRREPRTGTGDWIKPSIAEVSDRGGGCRRERGRAYPVPSPRGTLPTWILSGDDFNLVHNRRSSLVQARISWIFFSWGSVLPLRSAFTSFAFFVFTLPYRGLGGSPSPSDLSQITRVYKTRAPSLVPRQGPIQGSPVADCACPTTRLQSCPHPWQISSFEIRSSALPRTELGGRQDRED